VHLRATGLHWHHLTTDWPRAEERRASQDLPRSPARDASLPRSGAGEERGARPMEAETSSGPAADAPGAAGLAAARVPLLEGRGLAKNFGGTQALKDVDFALHAGETLALLGENGAGKSTLIKILAAIHAADAGEISFRGRDVTGNLRRLPIAFIHQDLGLIEWMTVAE